MSTVYSSPDLSSLCLHHSHDVHPEVQYSQHQVSRDIASAFSTGPGLRSFQHTLIPSLNTAANPFGNNSKDLVTQEVLVTILRLLTFLILNFKQLSVVVVTILKLFISITKSSHPSPSLCLGVLGFGQITCNLPIKFYQDILTFFLEIGRWGLGVK